MALSFPAATSGRLWEYLGDDLPALPVPRAAEGDRMTERALLGAIIVKRADPKLRYAVNAHERLSLWEFDEGLEVRKVS